ncbi:cytochrome P450 [Mycena rosella]|uniref:Cytochrome P450 n=1 Tax=Mycena rosella TaxID=1033263 RepID=A0AAD7GTA7_MYCRO|nr:cytochrome P450 [Mycena rosella]
MSAFDAHQAIRLLSVLAAVLCARYLLRRRRPPLPPGPRALPVLGNVRDLPKESPWVSFAEMGRKWGDIVSITVLGQTMIIINSPKVAEDLLDVKGANFSDRPVVQMGGELVGFRNALSLCQYGDRVRKERKLFHQLFGTSKAIERFLPLNRLEIRKLLQYLVRHPDGAVKGVQRTTGAIVFRIAYGYRIAEGPDRFLDLFDVRSDIFARSTQPAAFLVNFIPALRYWPAWLPGGGFRKLADKWAKHVLETVNAPHEYVKQQMAAGTAEESFTSTLLHERPDEEYLIKWAASAILAGGSSTTSSQLEAFFLSMSLYPEIQAEAQRELDRVVGTERLPELSDRPELPYINALCKEVLRWHNAAPTGESIRRCISYTCFISTGVPHRTREDFVYEREGGDPPLLIPKDSLIITNIWHMTHDPTRYRNPLAFDPSRFIPTDTKKAEQDPSRICFGYGRRICPGPSFSHFPPSRF